MINVDEVGEDGESRNDDGVDIHVDTAKTRVWKAVEEKRGGLAVRTQKGEVYIRTRAIGGCRSVYVCLGEVFSEECLPRLEGIRSQELNRFHL